MMYKKINDHHKDGEPKKRVGILFSSGLDSTYLMYKNLSEGNAVYPIYVEIKNNENKSKIEKQNVKMLVSLFSKNFGYNRVHDAKFITEISVNAYDNDLLLQQVPVWIFGMMYLPLGSYDEIQIGYVANDDALSYLNEIKKIYNSYKWLSRDKKLPKLVFPLTQTTKEQMMRDLPYEYRLYMSSCENPKLKPYFMKSEVGRLQFFEPCGHCIPCTRIIKDRLAYNDHYRKMIENDANIMHTGYEFNNLKREFPEQFENFKTSLYSEIRKIEDQKYESEIKSKIYDGDGIDRYESSDVKG